ncbi:D-alanyl-D-alanine-adding enzyme [Gammaproteobacteria bacterium]
MTQPNEKSIQAEGIRMPLSEAASLLQGKRLGQDVSFFGVSNDTRKMPSGALYVALVGDRFDGHAFVAEAKKAGAVAALVSREVKIPFPQIVVKDTRLALGQLATAWRTRFVGPLVAITGSNGKTTVKEMTRAIFAQKWKTLSTMGNLNNDIGTPLTLLRLMPSVHQAAVIELGANHPGEIAYLTALAKPTVALVNNAGPAHLEGFGSVEGVARAKGEIYQGLSKGGIAVINADDPQAPLWRAMTSEHTTLDFGMTASALVRATDLRTDDGTAFTLHSPLGTEEVRISLPGRHNVLNALAAATVALAAELSLGPISTGLASVTAVSGRLRSYPGRHGVRIIDDTYNANPASLRAAIEVLAKSPGERYLVLGDMGELGPNAPLLHAEIGEFAKQSGIDRLVACGKLSQEAVAAFGEGALHCAEVASVVAVLEPKLHSRVTILVKGSRSAGMERVVQLLS